MKKVVSYIGSSAALLAVPFVASAQVFDEGELFTGFVEGIIGFIEGALIPLLFAVALLVFLYGVYKYFIASSDDPGKRGEAVQLMLYGLGGFVLMFAVWGIVEFLIGGLGFDSSAGTPTPPAIPSGS